MGEIEIWYESRGYPHNTPIKYLINIDWLRIYVQYIVFSDMRNDKKKKSLLFGTHNLVGL